MNKLLYSLFLSVFFLDFLHFDLRIIPRSATWMPEVLAILTCLIVVLQGAFRKEFAIHQKYVYLILLYSTIILIGIILNTTPPGSIIIGLRFYFKHLPFFLLPAVCDFSDKQFKKQLLFILPLLILQCPLAVYQRLYFNSMGVFTGDVVTGTVMVSGPLSIIMICSIAVFFALYLRGEMGLKFFLITACCLFLPTTLNETKVTIFMLPLALFLPLFFSGAYLSSQKRKGFLTMALLGVLFFSAFVPIYDHVIKPSGEPGLFEFFQKEGQLEKYLYREAEGRPDDPGDHVRRGDAIVLAYKDLSKDPITFAFGLGMGTVMDSYFESVPVKYAKKLQYGGQMLAVTQLFWEIGLLGVAVYATFFVFLFRDALLLKKSDDIFGSFALGWSAVVVIIGVCLIYNNMFHFNVINFMFWYFSGLVAAKTFRARALRKKYEAEHTNIAGFVRS